MKVLSFEASLVKYIKFFKVSLSGFRTTCLFGDYLQQTVPTNQRFVATGCIRPTTKSQISVRSSSPTSGLVVQPIKIVWQLPTLPRRFHRSTIGVKRLNFCVRHGYRCIPLAFITILIYFYISINNSIYFQSSFRFISIS